MKKKKSVTWSFVVIAPNCWKNRGNKEKGGFSTDQKREKETGTFHGLCLFSAKSMCGTSISSSSCCYCKNQNTQTKKKSSLSPYFGSIEEPTPTKSPNSEHGMHRNWSKFHSRRSKPQPLTRNPHPLGGNPTLPTKTTIKIDTIRQNRKKEQKSSKQIRESEKRLAKLKTREWLEARGELQSEG